MTKKEILAHLVEWERVQRELDAQLDLFCDLTRAQPDSPLFGAIYKTKEAHLDAVALIVGDKGGWLNWWAFENDYGAKAMGACLMGGALSEIKTLNELSGLIADS